MESAFGVDLSGIEAVFGGSSAGSSRNRKPNLKAGDGAALPAGAATDGKTIWFARPNPKLEQVAHEVTHVVQNMNGAGASGMSRMGDSNEQEAGSVAQAVARGAQNVEVAQSASSGLHGDWLDDVGDALGDAFDMRDNEEALDCQEDIAEFKSQNYGPLTYTRPNISGSGFEASYQPGADRLLAEVRAKVNFADALVVSGTTVSSPNHFMNQGQLITTLSTFPALATQVLPYFQWSADEKEITKLRFFDNMSATASLWEDTGMSLQVDETGWEGVVARPDVDIKISEGTAVSATENYGPFGLLESFDEQGSDHLQLEIVKQMNAADAATVNSIISAWLTANAPGVAAPPPSDTTAVRSYLGNDSGAARSGNPAGHNNFMSLESDRSNDTEGRTYNHSVYFEHGETAVNASEQAKLDTFLADPLVLLQNPTGTVTVELFGFASAPGSTKSNEKAVAERLTSVSDLINAVMDSSSTNIQTHVDPATQTNDSDRTAEMLPFLDPSFFRRVDVRIEHTGRGGQNVMAHEFGHILGLGDEYVETANGYNRPAGALADHDQLAKDAGVPTGAVVGDDNRIMSTGNSVGPAHYATFADALRQLTEKPWKVV